MTACAALDHTIRPAPRRGRVFSLRGQYRAICLPLTAPARSSTPARRGLFRLSEAP